MIPPKPTMESQTRFSNKHKLLPPTPEGVQHSQKIHHDLVAVHTALTDAGMPATFGGSSHPDQVPSHVQVHMDGPFGAKVWPRSGNQGWQISPTYNGMSTTLLKGHEYSSANIGASVSPKHIPGRIKAHMVSPPVRAALKTAATLNPAQFGG